jgi:hypothetical protein
MPISNAAQPCCPNACSAMAPTKPPGTVGRYNAGVIHSGGVRPVERSATHARPSQPGPPAPESPTEAALVARRPAHGDQGHRHHRRHRQQGQQGSLHGMAPLPASAPCRGARAWPATKPTAKQEPKGGVKQCVGDRECLLHTGATEPRPRAGQTKQSRGMPNNAGCRRASHGRTRVRSSLRAIGLRFSSTAQSRPAGG